MKLLLTSAGLMNATIAQAVVDLAGLEKGSIKLVFIPTAAGIEAGDKGWLINDFIQLKNQGYELIDIVDIAAVPREVWQPRIESANVICVGGGDEQFLARIMRETGFGDLLPALLETRLYVGISAGSMVMAELLPQELANIIYPEQKTSEKGFGFINGYILPHFNSPLFPNKRKETIGKLKDRAGGIIYALDDQSALKVIDGEVEIISEGKYLKL